MSDTRVLPDESPTRDLRHSAKQQHAMGNQRPQAYRPRHAAPEPWGDTHVIERVRIGTEPVASTKTLLVPCDPPSHRMPSRAPGAALAAQQSNTSRLSGARKVLAEALRSLRSAL